jgi:hypothetical protein
VVKHSTHKRKYESLNLSLGTGRETFVIPLGVVLVNVVALMPSALSPMLHKKEEVNRTARIRHQCRKTIVLSCHRCLINTGIEKMSNI